jgi:sec-independent protein translocase protein TatB
MLRSMFGMGGTEILVILIVALLFLGPDKLPEAAKKISKGIRDIKKQSRVLQRTIEDDEHIGGAIRDLKSALRGDEIRPKIRKALEPVTQPLTDAAKTLTDAAKPEAAKPEAAKPEAAKAAAAEPAPPEVEAPKETRVLPDEAGEHHDPDAPATTAEDDAALAGMIKPASGSVAKTKPTAPPAKAADGHG